MPQVLKDTYRTTRVILDCTEIFIETPSDYAVQSATYSAYKGQNTAKGLVGISPNGMVTFVADLAPGRLSDKEITRCSGLYKKLEQGDPVMADRGFLIEDDLAELGVSLNIPPFMKGKSQLSLQDEQETRKIAKIRIHVERVIGQLKTFKVLKQVYPITMSRKLNSVWKACAYMYNFMNEPLVDRRLLERKHWKILPTFHSTQSHIRFHNVHCFCAHKLASFFAFSFANFDF
uniref:Isl2eu-1 cs n=1 Tax=Rhipicephalus zambeziensis TaxID=60191 RepID=A0A224YRY4_9ACAR